MLDAFAAVEIRRRRRLIPKLVRRVANLPTDERTGWMSKNQRQMNRAIEDILELSSYVTQIFHIFY